jgi:hypothetical protein
MKKLIITIILLAAFVAGGVIVKAKAGTNCTTTCYTVGNQRVCNTTCY